MKEQEPILFEFASDDDPVYKPENLEHLCKSIKQVEDGKVVIKTVEELEAMEKE